MTLDNEQLIRRLWEQIWFEGGLDRLDEVVADPYIRHTRDGTVSSSPAEYGLHLGSVVRMIRGTELEFHTIECVDDLVFVRLNLHGVNLDTGDVMRLTSLAHYRIADGRVAESWAMHQPGLDW